MMPNKSAGGWGFLFMCWTSEAVLNKSLTISATVICKGKPLIPAFCAIGLLSLGSYGSLPTHMAPSIWPRVIMPKSSKETDNMVCIRHRILLKTNLTCCRWSVGKCWKKSFCRWENTAKTARARWPRSLACIHTAKKTLRKSALFPTMIMRRYWPGGAPRLSGRGLS